MDQPHRGRGFRTALIGAILVAAGIGLGQVVEDSIDVGQGWVGGLVYNSRTDVVYGSCQYTDGTFFAIDCATNQVIRSFWIPWPQAAAYDSIDNKAYVTFERGGEDSVMVIDGTTHTRTRAIGLEWANVPIWDPLGNKLYVSCGEANEVGVIDCATDSVVAHIPVGVWPNRMAISPSHRRLYVGNWDGETVSVIDLNTNTVVTTIPVNGVPESGCFSEVAGKYYCGSTGPYGRVVVVDGSTDSVVAELGLLGVASLLSVESHGRVLAAAVYSGSEPDTVFAIDGQTNAVVSRLPVGRGPWRLTWSPWSDLVYVAMQATSTVEVLDPLGTAVRDTLRVSRVPFVMQPTPARNRLYVAHLNSSKVYVVRDVAGIGEVGGVELAEDVRPAMILAGASLEWAGEDAVLVDVSGRCVLRLKRGDNSLNQLAPGAYFVRDTRGGPAMAQKVLITK